MDYEKKYKEALERAKKGECLENVFPELKESEDEKIRKALIELVKYNGGCLQLLDKPFNDVSMDIMLDWLEKQSKRKSVISDDALREGIAHFGITQYQIDNWLKKYVDVEKQSEQKLFDNIKPKFKVGDWCIDNEDNTIFQITKVLSNLYYYRTNEGKEYSCTRDSIERDAHLWTIQDAKDGDVFVAEIDEEPNDFIYIFKEYNQNLGFWSHCYLDAYTNKFHEGIYHNNLNIGVPAAKEQRDMFFQKMHEAGYEWDFEVKELNKIEKMYNNKNTETC